MPYSSDRQRRYIYAQAAKGEAWARKYIQDSGDKPPKVRVRARHLKRSRRL